MDVVHAIVTDWRASVLDAGRRPPPYADHPGGAVVLAHPLSPYTNKRTCAFLKKISNRPKK